MEELYIDVEEARGLQACDPNGKSDPYAVLTLLRADGSELSSVGKFRTKTISKTRHPQWHQTFLIGGDAAVDLHQAATLRVVLWDKDMLVYDDCLGVVTIPMETINKLTAPLDQWYKVEKYGSMAYEATGELRLIIRPKEADSA